MRPSRTPPRPHAPLSARAVLGFTLVTVLAVLACSERGPTTPLEPSDAALTVASQADPSVPVVSLANLETVGTARVVRTPQGVNYQVRTSGLQPGHAYTLWLLIFNDADECVAGGPGGALCGPPDFENPDIRPDFLYGAGGLASGDGTLTFAGRLGIDEEGRSINAPVGLLAYGLQNPSGAEIHAFVHSHGPKLPDYMPDQITTVDGGCTDAGVPASGVASPWNDHEFGRRGPNTCQTIQAAVLTPGA